MQGPFWLPLISVKAAPSGVLYIHSLQMPLWYNARRWVAWLQFPGTFQLNKLLKHSH
jgi:hypothetical protein